jgi:hypothetical protein
MDRIALSINIEFREFSIEDWQFFHLVLKRGVAEERRIAEFLGRARFCHESHELTRMKAELNS